MKFYTTLLAVFLCLHLSAQDGYQIKVTLKPFKNQYVYLGHYFGKQLPIVDSVLLNDKSEGVFKGPKKLGGGIYLIGFPDRSRNFEILVDKNQHFSVIADTSSIGKISFQNSPENAAFVAYQDFMMKRGRKADSLYRKRSEAGNAGDSVKIVAQLDALNAEIRTYRNSIIGKDNDNLLPVLLKGMREPEVPQNHPDAKKDSMFAYKYYKAHYWDDVNFWDDRLARTPFFESRIDKYFENLVYPAADSVIKEIDWMLGFAANNEDMQKFLLLKFVNRYLNQKYMWEDAVFVHIFEKYFAQKNYPWLTEKGKKTITDRAYSLMANILGNPAADIELPDINDKKTALYNVKAPFVLVTIWDATCGHCKDLVPKLDSLYHAKWKGMGLKMFGMAKETDGTKKDWLSFIKDHKLNDWTHVYYSKADDKGRVDSGIPSYSQLYDVQSFPTLYLLDKDKRIIAKKITEQQVDEILGYKIKNQ